MPTIQPIVRCNNCGHATAVPFTLNEAPGFRSYRNQIQCRHCGTMCRIGAISTDDQGAPVVVLRPGDSLTWLGIVDQLKERASAARTPEEIAAIEADPRFAIFREVFAAVRKILKPDQVLKWGPLIVAVLTLIQRCGEKHTDPVVIQFDQIVNICNEIDPAARVKHPPPRASKPGRGPGKKKRRR